MGEVVFFDHITQPLVHIPMVPVRDSCGMNKGFSPFGSIHCDIYRDRFIRIVHQEGIRATRNRIEGLTQVVYRVTGEAL